MTNIVVLAACWRVSPTLPAVLYDCPEPRLFLPVQDEKSAALRQQASPDRLSVTFGGGEEAVFSPGSPPAAAMDKVRFPGDAAPPPVAAEKCQSKDGLLKYGTGDLHDTEQEEDPGYIGTMETAISVEECITQEQIVERLRLHKEVLSSVKQQPWGMRRKLRLVKQAKAYVKQHEGELRERRTTRHLLSRCHLLVIKRWQHTRRELDNLMNALIPWELRIKQIESHFGSVVASYFTFLRWLFWVNLVITVLLVAFVAIPEVSAARRDIRHSYQRVHLSKCNVRKEMLPRERRTATNLDTLWDFDGVLKYSPIFYGYYTNRDAADTGYRLPFAYFMTGIAVYAYSFVATLRKMAENSRMSKLSEKDDECVFTWKLFTGWDYMIGNAETAHNRVASIVLGFKEALLEEAERRRDARNWRVLCLRALVNLAVLVLLASSAYAVVEVVKRSNQTSPSDSWWRQNEITVVMSLIQYVYPILFEVLGLLESYHPRKQLRIQLARIMALNMLSLYTLIIALFDKIKDMTADLEDLRPLIKGIQQQQTTTTPPYAAEGSSCRQVAVQCPSPAAAAAAALSLGLLLASSPTAPPITTDLAVHRHTGEGAFTEATSDFLSTSSGQLTITTEVDYLLNYTEPEEGEQQSVSGSLQTRTWSTDLTSSTVIASESEDSTSSEFSMSSESSSTADTEYESDSTSDTAPSQAPLHASTSLPLESTMSTVPNTIAVSDGSETNETSMLPTVKTTTEVPSPASAVTHNEDGLSHTTTAPTPPVSGHPHTAPNRSCYIWQCDATTPQPKNSAGSTICSGTLDGQLNETIRERLRDRCWETMFGQELMKLTVMDLVSQTECILCCNSTFKVTFLSLLLIVDRKH
ncbi:transmembrane channel-like protein [Schistocerca nitens]|uniref:transmembrane channel-like protein n=1 Tax=Schistocerca nitens TaxID=7011 RepID=UPI002117BBDA|nr:transmembrane channel-like protein [Schistocerca nitens]